MSNKKMRIIFNHICLIICAFLMISAHKFIQKSFLFLGSSASSNITVFSSTSHKEDYMFKGIINNLLPMVGHSVSTLILSASRGLTRYDLVNPRTLLVTVYICKILAQKKV